MHKTIYFGGGCFWGVQAYLDKIPGVLSTQAGYANGNTERPTYEEVCRKHTGHAETVETVYDDSVISLPFLLSLYYEIIDPTAINRQGGDSGIQYRTGIYYTDAEDGTTVTGSLKRLQKEFTRPVAVEALPLSNFYPAEEYHQKYLVKNPGGYCHIGQEHFQRAAKAKEESLRYPVKTREELRRALTPLQYEVTQNAATEPPYTNEYDMTFERGIYVDVTTGEPLFLSSAKFNSGCGWPAFAAPITEERLEERKDFSHGMQRTEVRSRHGGAHLGHVFHDGPAEKGGLRYCINSAALRFIPEQDLAKTGYAEYLPLLAPKQKK